MNRILRALDRHFFEPAPLRDLGVLRIVLVGTQVLYLIFGSGLVFGAVGRVLERQMLLAHAAPETFLPLPALKLLMLPFGWGTRPEPMFLAFVWGLGLIAGVSALVGLYSRLSLFCLAYTSTLLIAHGYSYREFHHPETILVIMLWVLVAAPVGGLSVDRLRRRVQRAGDAVRFVPSLPADDSSPLARWPFRVGQWLLVLAYFSAAKSKIATAGLDWFNGYTLTYYLLQDGTWRDIPVAVWLASQHTLAVILSLGTGLFEATFVLAVLVPRVAWVYVLTGTLMHIMIYVTQRAQFFTFMALYVVFLEPLRASWLALRARIAMWRSAASPSAVRGAVRPTLIFDGRCVSCVRAMTLLDAIGGRGRLAYVDAARDWETAATLAPGLSRERAGHAIHVVPPDGRVLRGFDAFRFCTRVVPVLRVLFPLVRLPFVAALAARAYAGPPARRDRVAACDCDRAMTPAVPATGAHT